MRNIRFYVTIIIMNNRPKVKGFGQVMAFIKAGKEDVNWREDGSLLAAGVLGHSLGTLTDRVLRQLTR